MSACECKNHLGRAKNQYKSHEQALKQALWHIKRSGAKHVIVTCKTDPNIFHIITERNK